MANLTSEEASERKLLVAKLHLLGHNHSSIHRHTGVARDTIKRWLSDDKELRNILSLARDAMVRDTAGDVAKLLPKAFAVIAEALEDGDRKVAMQFLNGIGILQSAGRMLGGGDDAAAQAEGRVLIQVNIDQQDRPSRGPSVGQPATVDTQVVDPT